MMARYKTIQVPPPKFSELVSISSALGKSLLLQYSEWLDVEKINLLESDAVDGRSHSDLIDEFLAKRNQNAIPVLEE